MNAKEKINEISKLCLAGEGWGGVFRLCMEMVLC